MIKDSTVWLVNHYTAIARQFLTTPSWYQEFWNITQEGYDTLCWLTEVYQLSEQMKMSKYENNDSISKEYLQHIPDELVQVSRLHKHVVD